MNSIATLSLEDFRRLPGLYRRWELTEVCEPNRSYQIEDAGAHADGTPLVAIYVADPPCLSDLHSTGTFASSQGRFAA